MIYLILFGLGIFAGSLMRAGGLHPTAMVGVILFVATTTIYLGYALDRLMAELRKNGHIK